MKKVTINNIGYQIFRPLIKIYLLIVACPKTIHKERVPKKDGFILAGTHVSYLDPLIVGNTTKRSVHFLAKKELIDTPVLGKVLRFMGVVRVDRSTHNPDAKKEAIEVLQSGNVICLFPEGTRNLTENPLLPFKYGAISFAYNSQKPIVPFAIVGSKRPHPFYYHSKIIMGNPFYVKTDDYEKENAKFMQIVLDLIEEGKKYEKK